MTIRSAEEAKKIVALPFSERERDVQYDDRSNQAQGYLSALRGPEVSELVEAAKNYLEHKKSKVPITIKSVVDYDHALTKFESALAKIEEAIK
jgi:hypothetical protein